MQEMLQSLIGLTLLAFALERGVEYLFSMQPFLMLNERYKNLKFKTMAAFFMGFGIAYFAQLDIIGILLNNMELKGVPGYVFTGLLLAGGSNVFSDLMKMIQSLKTIGDKSSNTLPIVNNVSGDVNTTDAGTVNK